MNNVTCMCMTTVVVDVQYIVTAVCCALTYHLITFIHKCLFE